MSAIERIRTKLTRYPDVRFTATATEVRVPATSQTGFSVWLRERPDGFTVAFEGWHEEFTSEDDALNCFAWGLTPECRLRIDLRGDFPYRWTVESLHEGLWEYRQNHVVPAA